MVSHFKEARDKLLSAYKMVNMIDYLLEQDTGAESFLSEWELEIK
jgi:hypothetical protein